MTLRDYQIEALIAIRREFERVNSTLLVLPTGCGKTKVFTALASEMPGRVLVLAHTKELIDQAADTLKEVTGQKPAIEMGEDRSLEQGLYGKPKYIVSTVQTMSRLERQQRFDPAEFSLVVIDEAHRAVNPQYLGPIRYFQRNPACKLLLVTATPQRSDQKALGMVAQTVAYQLDIVTAIDAGWLVPIRQQAVKVEGLDFSHLRSLKGDFTDSQLEEVLTEESILHRVAAPLADLAGDRSTLVFCINIKHARAMSAVLNRYKPGCAGWAAGQGAMEMEDRSRQIARFKAGELQMLCSCALIIEGFDAPRAAVVAMARPTKSLPLYIQALGRSTRALPGIVDGLPTAQERKQAIAASAKPFATVLDFVGNSGRHKIITSTDVLGGRYGEPVRTYAKKTAQQEGTPTDTLEGLDRADAELALEAAMEARRKKIAARRVSYDLAEVSPFHRGSRVAGMHQERLPGTSAQPPLSGKQLRMLISLGIHRDTARRMHKRQASALIDKLLKARRARQQEAQGA